MNNSKRNDVIIPVSSNAGFANELNLINLGNFTLSERRILMAIFSKCKELKPGDSLHMTKQDFYDLHIYPEDSHFSPAKVKNHFLNTMQKCQDLNFIRVDSWNGNEAMSGELISLFEKIRFDFHDGWNIEFRISKEIYEFFSGLINSTSRFSLYRHQLLKSKYSQDLFRLLSQHISTGRMEISKEDFKNSLYIKDKYTEDNITKRILNPAVEDLSAYFPNLRYIKIKAGNSRKVIGYCFEWDSMDTRQAIEKNPD